VEDFIALFNTGGFSPGSFRISRILRPIIFLCFTNSLRGAAARVARSIKGFLSVLFALAIALIFFTWAGITIFAEQGTDDTHFPNWSAAFTNLWILFTTANCPDAFLTIYNTHRLAVIFFIAYLILTLYLLNNILLARVYDAYKEELKEMVITWAENEQTAISHAFALLKNEQGVIERKKWAAFFTRHQAERRRFLGTWGHKLEDYNSKRAEAVFYALDSDHTQGIDESEFKSVLDVLHDEEVYIPTTRPPAWQFLRGWYAAFTSGVKVFGRQVPWDTLIDVVIFVGVVLAFVQTVLWIDQGHFLPHYLSSSNTWFWVLFAFTCFYVVELIAKIGIMGLERYLYNSPFMNSFDLVTISGLMIVEFLCLSDRVPQLSSHHGDQIRVGPKLTVLLHIARSIRLFRHVEPLNFIARLSVRISPAYFRMGLLLFIIYYIYAMIGIQCFGGEIYQGNPMLANTTFANTGYYPFNFNDFDSGMVTLFVLMVVNNWFVIAGGFIAASGTRWTAVFFVTFFVITNLVVLNILIAMVLDCSAKILGENGDDADASKDTYVAMIRRALLDIDEDHLPGGASNKSIVATPTAGYGATSESSRPRFMTSPA
jgi:two pore calcium channel protein